MANLGLTDMRGRFRWAQAAIVTLAGNRRCGNVQEVDGLQSASVGIGAGWREPAVAAQVEWLRLNARELTMVFERLRKSPHARHD